MRFQKRIDDTDNKMKKQIDQLLSTYGLVWQPSQTRPQSELTKMWRRGVLDRITEEYHENKDKLLKKAARDWVATYFQGFNGAMRIIDKEIFLTRSGKNNEPFRKLPQELWEQTALSFNQRLTVYPALNAGKAIRNFDYSTTEESQIYKEQVKRRFSKKQQLLSKFDLEKEDLFLREMLVDDINEFKEWLGEGKAIKSLRKELVAGFREELEALIRVYNR